MRNARYSTAITEEDAADLRRRVFLLCVVFFAFLRAVFLWPLARLFVLCAFVLRAAFFLRFTILFLLIS